MAVIYAKDKPQGFTNRITKVVVVGASGNVGKHFTEALVKTGNHTVTAITRPDSSSTFPSGVHVVRVDYNSDDSSALVDALRGQQFLLVTVSVAAPQDTISKFVRAAAVAGVPYILPNWFGPDPANHELCKDTLLAPRRDSACDEIKELGVSKYLLLACNFWYEFSLGGGPDRYGFDFVNKTLVLFDGGNAKINTTTWPQCGRAIAKLLSLKELPDDESDKSATLAQFANGTAYISSFLLSQNDMFESVKRVTNTTDLDWTIIHESSETRWKEAMSRVQNGDWTVFTRLLYSRTWFPNGGGDFESKMGLANELLSLPAEDLDRATAEGVCMGENGEVHFEH